VASGQREPRTHSKKIIESKSHQGKTSTEIPEAKAKDHRNKKAPGRYHEEEDAEKAKDHESKAPKTPPTAKRGSSHDEKESHPKNQDEARPRNCAGSI
jgi:hypothetical protein